MPFVSGFHLFRGELGFGRNEGNFRWQGLFRQGVEHYPGLITNGQAAAGRCWQVEVHVLVAGIDQHQYPSASAQYFTGFGQA
ncbi:hypothetical protein D3C77_652940 [compost metagenome]